MYREELGKANLERRFQVFSHHYFLSTAQVYQVTVSGNYWLQLHIATHGWKNLTLMQVSYERLQHTIGLIKPLRTQGHRIFWAGFGEVPASHRSVDLHIFSSAGKQSTIDPSASLNQLNSLLP